MCVKRSHNNYKNTLFQNIRVHGQIDKISKNTRTEFMSIKFIIVLVQ